MVEQVKEVHAELDAHSLTPHPPVLVHREVGVDVAWTVTVATRLDARRIRFRSGSRSSVTACGLSTCAPLNAGLQPCPEISGRWLSVKPLPINESSGSRATSVPVAGY